MLPELLLFMNLCPFASPVAFFFFLLFFPQQVAHILSLVLLILIGQPIDRLSARASTQLKQLHEVSCSIRYHVFNSFSKSLNTGFFFVYFTTNKPEIKPMRKTKIH